MESFPSTFGPTQPVPGVPLTMRSTPSTKTKKISPAAAAELAAAATATVKYDRWERVPREPDHLCRSAQDTKNQILFQRQLKGGKMDDYVLHRMRMDAAQKFFDNMKKIEKDQYERKARLWKEIETNENNTWENANEMLRKYERLKSGIVRIHKNFQKDLDQEQKELITMKESSESKIKDIEDELSILDSLLEAQNTEYTELLNYKHEIYPLKAMTIKGLKADIEGIKKDNEIEEKYISYVMSSEMARYQKRWNNEEIEMAKMISEMSFDLMPPDIKKMMVENVIMTKEIKSHLKAKEDMEQQINSLTEEIKHLSRLNYRTKIFPEFFPNKVKCNPDVDIVLDIPQKTFLPI